MLDGDGEAIGAGVQFATCAAPLEVAVHWRGHADVAGGLHADLDRSFRVGDGTLDELQLTQVGAHDYARESGGGGIDTEYGAHQFDIRTRAPGVAVRAGGMSGTVHDFGEGGEAGGQHAAPIVQLLEVAIAFADFGEWTVFGEVIAGFANGFWGYDPIVMDEVNIMFTSVPCNGG